MVVVDVPGGLVAEGNKQYSRREFARKAVLISAATPLAGVPVTTNNEAIDLSDNQQPKLPSDFPKLSEQSRAEAEERYKTILAQYGGRFSEVQKTDLQRLCYIAQPPLDKLRAYKIQNGDGPALYLRPIVEREKKPVKSVPATTTPAARKPQG